MPTMIWWFGTRSEGAATVDVVSRWIWGAFGGLIGLVGLFMAARGHDLAFEFAGYLLMLFSILFIFTLIRHYVGRDDKP